MMAFLAVIFSPDFTTSVAAENAPWDLGYSQEESMWERDTILKRGSYIDDGVVLYDDLKFWLTPGTTGGFTPILTDLAAIACKYLVGKVETNAERLIARTTWQACLAQVGYGADQVASQVRNSTINSTVSHLVVHASLSNAGHFICDQLISHLLQAPDLSDSICPQIAPPDDGPPAGRR